MAIVVEWIFLKKSSTLYAIYTKNFSWDLRKDFFIWVMEIIMIWPFIGRLLTLSVGVYVGSILNDWFFKLSSVKLILLVPYFWLQVILALAAGDLLFYWLHRFFHISESFWQLHKYHHSTTSMTVFSGSRDNPVVGSIWALATGIPSAIFGSPAGIPDAVIFLSIFHTQIIHSKINHNWGFVGKWIVVSPHSHLIHHSAHESHRDKNFSFLFPIWDHLFGTWYSGKNHDTSMLGIPNDPQNHFPCKQILINWKIFIKMQICLLMKLFIR
ncbi:sterol desaturase family protein [Polynucleobacter necessarius]|uniref:sterol desaturase family protein n=1 Tax=Polynucleobacter necessarius TaxID=576610 RepID=UPI0013B05AE1|nr:sterol desaturase family protein [Polynucleobacter necessarius]